MKKSKIKEVGAITVIQPWTNVIVFRGKNVENRQKNFHYRGTIAIHASATKSKAWFEDCPIKFKADNLSFGSIIGFADLVDVITKKSVTAKTKKWFGGKYGLVLKNVIPLRMPVKTKGKRGVWKLKGKALKTCLDQLTPKQIKKFREFKKIS